MKKHNAFLLIFIYAIAFSQTHRFIYQLQKKSNNEIQTINMVLDIDKDKVRFYDYDFLKIDSIRKKTGEIWQTNTASDQLVLRKLNTFQNKSFHDNLFNYFEINSYDEINWKIESETKKSGEYILQKATTTFGGRNWIAWFCLKIPFQEGPYKFRGLPGLIFELKDEENNFVYSLIKSTNLSETFDTSNFLETHYGIKPVAISLKQYYKLKLDYYNDPVSEMRSNLKDGGAMIINGEKITTQEQLDKRRKFLQEQIIKYYNPIELDKAIPYLVK